MLDTRDTFFTNLARNVRLADVIDVALLALFLYVVIAWIRRDTSRGTTRRALTVTVLFVLVYSLANTFQLYLIERLIQVLLIAFLVATVVIFQSDIRRLLDRIGSWSLFRRPLDGRDTTNVVDVLTETAAKLADEHTGALIAIKGREPWERLLHGGVMLNGHVSQPLLFSLFDESSPGHDGAVLLEGGSVTCFAVHLPLTEQLPEASRYGGTRHAAALGLAEQCDAFVIVVSEERGTVSIAEGGQITELDTPSELKEQLMRFWQRHYRRSGATRPHQDLWRRLQNASLALFLSVVLWLLFAYSPEMVYRNFSVPIEFRSVPEGWTLTQVEPVEAQIAISGSQQAFRAIIPSQLAISFDLEEPQEGDTVFTVSAQSLRLPQGLSLYNAEPESVRVEVRRLIRRQVPVHVSTSGALPDSLQLVALQPDPDSVLITMPSGTELPDSIATEPLDLSEVTGSTSTRRALVVPPEITLAPEQPQEVTIRVEVQRPSGTDS